MAKRWPSRQGNLAAQSASPYIRAQSFLGHATVEAAGFSPIRLYQAYVPSYGHRGFVLAS